MKVRNGFISNSSSSSFIVQKRNLNNEQIYMIKNHIDFCFDLIKEDEIKNDRKFIDNDPYGEENWKEDDITERLKKMMMYGERYSVDKQDRWHVEEGDKTLYMSTFMDNFDMLWFLLNIVGVDEKDIKGEEY